MRIHMIRRLAYALMLLTTAVAASGAASAAGQVVISQVYGGGGNSGATLTNDFIELHNDTSVPVSVDGWSVQYASSTGTSHETHRHDPGRGLLPGRRSCRSWWHDPAPNP
jgi:predicted extracellular nuclease